MSGSPEEIMRAMTATLALINAIASLALSVAYAANGAAMDRMTTLVLWAATLVIAVISGAVAHRYAARRRAGMMRSMIALVFAFVSLVVGVIVFLL